MIKIDNGAIEINGTGVELLADLSVITLKLKEIMKETGLSESKTNDTIQFVVNQGLMYEEPKESEISDTLKSILEHINRRV
ncbi:MAG: hypothetical protein E6600_04655 [Anaerocolumna aminovalerica]|uniref:hypothetical protein n=1 Tax=Anaerocolumna aminovalerica TaxID=1527 RepID=UPI00290C6463|nr:hypothetical protein [Anaerocolumna aminovalerica]MDU6263773.1 hypothetical protein [Anaerocolumna aminovalerica]